MDAAPAAGRPGEDVAASKRSNQKQQQQQQKRQQPTQVQRQRQQEQQQHQQQEQLELEEQQQQQDDASEWDDQEQLVRQAFIGGDEEGLFEKEAAAEALDEKEDENGKAESRHADMEKARSKGAAKAACMLVCACIQGLEKIGWLFTSVFLLYISI